MKCSSANKLLDLADVDEWTATSQKVASELLPEKVRQLIRQMDCNEMYSDLEYLTQAIHESGHDTLASNLNKHVDLIFRSKYQLIRSFHACRTSCIANYRHKGVIAHSPSLIESLAMNAIAPHAPREQILTAIRRTQETSPLIDNNKVYCHATESEAMSEGCMHYLRCGCEFLIEVLHHLDLRKKGILQKSGKAYLIELHIPIENLAADCSLILWNSMLNEVLKSETGNPLESPPCCMIYPISSEGNISPECIINISHVPDSELQNGQEWD